MEGRGQIAFSNPTDQHLLAEITSVQGLAAIFAKSRLQAKTTSKPEQSGRFSHQVTKSNLRNRPRSAIVFKRKSLI